MNERVTVVRKFEFCYSHYLPNYNGKCCRDHGHNSEVEVEFVNPNNTIETYDSMVIDFNQIKEIVEPIIEKLDHKNLSQFLPPKYLPATCENIARYLANEILKTSIGHGLIRIKVTETSKGYCQWLRS